MLRFSGRKEKKEKKEKEKKEKKDKKDNNSNDKSGEKDSSSNKKDNKLKVPELLALSSELCDSILALFNKFTEKDSEYVVEFINTLQELQQRIKVSASGTRVFLY